MAPIRPDRDLRIDFLRGMCLLLIYTRHVRPNFLSHYTPSEVGFSDAAEAFIFLSGFVTGRVYPPALSYGIIFTQLKAIRRCLQIYVAHIFTLFVNLTLVSSLFCVTHASGVRFFQDPVQGLQRVFLLSDYPYSYSILALYLFFLAPTPAMVYLGTIISRWGMVAVSYTLYGLVQIYPDEIALPPPWAEAIRFNPFAWQFLFFLGVALGSQPEDKFVYLPKGKAVAGAILAALVLCSYIKIATQPLDHWHLPPDALPWGKTALEPLRLLHFVLVGYLCWVVFPVSVAWYGWWLPRAVIWCGQSSLYVFCFSATLASLANESLRSSASSWPCQLVANVGGWIAMLLFGALLHAVKHVRRER